MIGYIARRVLLMIPTLLVISVIVFTIIELPPGDYLESYVAELQARGETVNEDEIHVPVIVVIQRYAGSEIGHATTEAIPRHSLSVQKCKARFLSDVGELHPPRLAIISQETRW